MESFYLGDVARLLFTVTSSTDSTVPVDPGGLTFHLTDPAGTTQSYVWGVATALATDGAGRFRVNWPVTVRGRYRGGWLATASHACADEFEFNALERRY